MFDGPRDSPTRSFAQLGNVAPPKAKSELSRAVKQRLLDRWFKAYGSACIECGVWMLRPRSNQNNRSPRFATIDHIRARALGGTNALSNLRVVCANCNHQKSRDENAELLRRKRMYRQRALKAARTRARNKASATREERNTAGARGPAGS